MSTQVRIPAGVFFLHVFSEHKSLANRISSSSYVELGTRSEKARKKLGKSSEQAWKKLGNGSVVLLGIRTLLRCYSGIARLFQSHNNSITRQRYFLSTQVRIPAGVFFLHVFSEQKSLANRISSSSYVDPPSFSAQNSCSTDSNGISAVHHFVFAPSPAVAEVPFGVLPPLGRGYPVDVFSEYASWNPGRCKM
jgi:hypothetical protein